MITNEPNLSAHLAETEKQHLLKFAREVIERALKGKPPLDSDAQVLSPRLREPGASFVTLRKGEQLRGCIGSLTAQRPLIEDVRQNALAAAFEDPRFPPLTEAELDQVRIEVSVLTKPEPLVYTDPDVLLRKLRPGIDGVIIERGWNRATFLPQVWEQIPIPEEFLAHLCRKARLPSDAWRSSELKVHTYQVEKFEEPDKR
jgi:AmmeMemoRadiSam system protein A